MQSAGVDSDSISLGMSFIGESEVAWRFPLAFQILFAVVIFTSISNLPESPRWLVMQGREDEALEILEALNEKPRDDPYIKNELIAIKETVKEMNKGSYRSLFKMSEYREFHRVALAYINQMFQQISGINLITYYVRLSFLLFFGLILMVYTRLHRFMQRLALDQAVCPSSWLLATALNTFLRLSSQFLSLRRPAVAH